MEQLVTDLLESIKGEGKPIKFTPEEYQRCKERYIKFSMTESDLEKETRQERAAAAANPVYITF